MSYYLGIDLGTSATKVVVLDGAGEVVARSRMAHDTSRRHAPGRVETCAWKASIQGALAEVAKFLPDITGVGFDVHCPVVVPLDAEGESVTLGVTWDNPALREYFEKYSLRRSPAAVAATGNHPSQSTFVGIVYPYLRDNDSEAFAAMHCFGFAGTWLGAQLTGKLALDPTQASYSGMYDTMGQGNRWIEETLSLLDIAPDKLPALQDSLTVLGEVTEKAHREYGIPQGVPVTVGSADTPAASFALGTRPGEAPFLILGTTHVINSCLSQPDARASALQRVGVRPDEWLINGVSNGGDSLAAGAVLTGFDSVPEMIDTAYKACKEEVDKAPFFLPHVMKERGPLWFEEPCGGIVGLSREITRAQSAWAVVEGVLMIDRMILEACVPPFLRRIYVTGAFGANEQLPQMLADVMGAELLLVEEGSLPAIGAAGMCRLVDSKENLPPVPYRQIVPRPEWKEIYDARWERYIAQWEKATGHARLEALQ